MKLPLPDFKRNKKTNSEYYLALLLRDEKAVAVVLEETEGKIQAIGRHQETFSTSLENVPYEELLNTLDKTISKAEETLPPNIETEKTVFGVKDTWVEEKKIKKDHLTHLKKLCDELSLSPIGFMVVSEAIANLLQKEEGAPLSGVLAEIGKTQVTLSLFRAGKPLEVHTAPIEDSVAKTVDKLLHHFTIDVLPSRIIVFNGERDEELAQEFIHHHWSKSLPFLHVPQVSVLPAGFDGRAMVYGAAEQMGFEILGSLGDTAVRDLTGKKTAELDEEEEAKDEETKEKNQDDLEKKEPEDSPIKESEDFGFVVGKEISSVSPAAKQKDEEETEEKTPTDEEHSYVINKPSDNLQMPDMERTVERQEDIPSRSRKREGGMLSGIALGGILNSITSLPQKLSGGAFSSIPSLMRKSKLFLIIPIVLIILIATIFIYVFQVKATVTLAIETKRIAETQDVSFSTDASNDFSDGIISAKEVEVSLEGSSTTNASGKKEVGEKAKGNVTLYNSDDVKKTIPAGTTLTSSNDRDFVTDKEIVIASASGDIFSGVKSGTAKVDVTAKAIGNEYNLPSNTEFNVGGSSTVAAKNEAAFSGGSKKEVTVVSKNDIAKLDADLPKSLTENAKNSLSNTISGDEAVLPEFTAITLSKKTYDHKEGEEAKTVTLKATVVFTTLSYNNKDVEEFAQSALKGKYTQDLAISDKGVTAEVQDIEVEDGDATAVLVMSAGLLPKLNEEQVKEDLTGKSLVDAQSELEKLPQVQSAEVTFSPNIPLLPKVLPRSKNNIQIKLTANE